jgi:drug/metabolite transporter (DMT)-like permease
MPALTVSAPSPFLVWSALVSVQVLFGINYVVSKIVVDAMPPLVWASIRVVIASVVMVAIALATRPQKHPTDGRKFFIPLIAFALLGIIINQGSFLVGLHYTTATNSAVLNTMIPVFTLLIVTLRGQEPLTKYRAMGFILSFAGVLVLRNVEQLTLSDKTLVGDLLTILNCLSYGLFLSYSKQFLQEHDRVWTTTWLFLYGSVGLGLVSIPAWIDFHPPEMTPMLVGAMVFGIVGGTLLTYFLNLWALAHTRSSSVALFIYLQPVVASALAWAWFDQQITTRTMIAGAMIFGGLLLALSKNQERHDTRQEPPRAPQAS